MGKYDHIGTNACSSQFVTLLNNLLNHTIFHSEVNIFYFFKCHSCILGKGEGWAVVSTILITLELFYSTKPIQRVAVSPQWTAKLINRAITKKDKKENEGGKTENKKKITNTRNDIQNQKTEKPKQKYILSTLKH